MLYQQTSIVINSPIENSWNILKKAMITADHKEIFTSCSNISDLKEQDGKISRVLHFPDFAEEELIIVNFSNYRINVFIQNNPNYFAEYHYILLRPTEEFLSEKHTSLVILSSWRMHPGIFAAPTIDKQEYINSVAQNLKNAIEAAT